MDNKITIEISLDNQAFSDNYSKELEFVMTQAMNKAKHYRFGVDLRELNLLDSNGNITGFIKYEGD